VATLDERVRPLNVWMVWSWADDSGSDGGCCSCFNGTEWGEIRVLMGVCHSTFIIDTLTRLANSVRVSECIQYVFNVCNTYSNKIGELS
jgi:hypothetical protein